MRIVSLLPSGTEIVYALGLGDLVVGRSHRCDVPEEVAALPAVTVSAKGGQDHVDVARLLELRPDLVITDASGDGIEPDCQGLREALRSAGRPATVVGLAACSLEGTFNAIASVGAYAEAEDEAVGLVELLRVRLGTLENRILERRLLGIASRRVVVLTALAPLVGAGRWVPELVRRAGGWDLLGHEIEDAEPTTWERLQEVDPEVVILALEGMASGSAERFMRAAREGALPPWFDDLAAVRDGELFAVSADLLLRPGPRLVDGVAMLAELIDPEGFAGEGPSEAWIPLGPVGIGTRRLD
jgi:iron complex transport system substrate-binding protein